MKIPPELPAHCAWWAFADGQQLAQSLALSVAHTLSAALAERERALLGVSGGSTPARFIAALAAQALPWSQVDVVLVDERWVPRDHPESNEKQLRQALRNTPMAAANVLSLYTGAETPAAGLAELGARSQALRWPLDVVVLGMGQDGHTASLFPHAPGLAAALAADAPHWVTAPAGLKGAARISLSLPVLRAARRTIVHIEGEAKLATLNAACRQRDAMAFPIWGVLADTASELVWAPDDRSKE